MFGTVLTTIRFCQVDLIVLGICAVLVLDVEYLVPSGCDQVPRTFCNFQLYLEFTVGVLGQEVSLANPFVQLFLSFVERIGPLANQ